MENITEILSNLKDYNEPEFGSFGWLSLQSGYAKIITIISEDSDVKNALKNMLFHVSKTQVNKSGSNLSMLLSEDNPWDLYDVLDKLIEASNILLEEKSYDGHGHEEIRHCVDRALEIKEVITKIKINNAQRT